jgi:hypothetical protein
VLVHAPELVVLLIGVLEPVRLLSVSYDSVLFGVVPVLPATVYVSTLELDVYVFDVSRPAPSVVLN